MMMMFMLVQFWLAIYAGIEFSPKIMRQNRKTRGMNVFFRMRVNLYSRTRPDVKNSRGYNLQAVAALVT